MIRLLGRVVAVSAFLVTAASAAMGQSAIEGTVRGPAGQPLQGIAVAAFNLEGTSSFGTTTNAQGRYTIPLSAGEYRLLAYDPTGVYATRFFPNADSFETSAILPLGQSTRLTGIDFQLERAGRVTGRVTDANGVALSGITVAAYNISGTRRTFTATASDGRYTIVLPPGNFRIAAYDNNLNFVTEFYNDTYDFAAAQTLGVDEDETIPSIDFQLARGAKITGRVIDASTGTGLRGKIVALYDSAGRLVVARESDATGAYGIAAPTGSYRLLAFDNDGIYATSYFDDAESFETSRALDLNVGQAFAADFRLQRGGRVTGRVTAKSNGAPLRDMVVAAYNLSGYRRGFIRTNAAGEFSILLPPGQYKVAAYDENLAYGVSFYRDSKTFADATVLSVAAGGASGGVDFAMEAPAAAGKRRRAARR